MFLMSVILLLPSHTCEEKEISFDWSYFYKSLLLLWEMWGCMKHVSLVLRTQESKRIPFLHQAVNSHDARQKEDLAWGWPSGWEISQPKWWLSEGGSYAKTKGGLSPEMKRQRSNYLVWGLASIWTDRQYAICPKAPKAISSRLSIEGWDCVAQC